MEISAPALTPKRILVFPCGSEIGLEIHRSLRYSTHFELVGASSVDDHGRFVYEQYVGDLAFHDTPEFIPQLSELIRRHRIDALYPAMDAVADTLKSHAEQLGITVIGSSPETTRICASKSATYQALASQVPLPGRYDTPETASYPVFIKPDRGYGSRNTFLAHDADAAHAFLARHPPESLLLLEYLPGSEWTIDCFSDRHGQLRFHAPRCRGRISHGISVHTQPSSDHLAEFSQWAEAINQTMRPRGAWFFQAKRDAVGHPRLLEVAARLGGSSGLFRCAGVNFALLSAFDAFGLDVVVEPNTYPIEMDRALDNRFQIAIDYRHVFVDLDDCVLIRGKLNTQLLTFLFQAAEEGKQLTLLTRHHEDPQATLRQHRIGELFDRIIHLTDPNDRKSRHIDDDSAIFIDDSHRERHDVRMKLGIPTFAPDMVEALIR